MVASLSPDLALIGKLIPEGSKVLDIGCEGGALLAWLAREKQVQGRGLEIDGENIRQSVAQGLAVLQGDANTDLGYYPDDSFDIAILGRTLQMLRDPKDVLQHMMRIAKQSIVSVPNFGYWKNRFYLLTHGRMPVTSSLSYQWYETPNIHFCTIRDFIVLCEELGIRILERYALTGGEVSGFAGRGGMANLLGEQGIFLLSRD